MEADADVSEMLQSLLEAAKGIAPHGMEALGFKPPARAGGGGAGNNKRKDSGSAIEHMDVLRREGNRFFKDSNHVGAMNLYSQCIVQSGETMELSETEAERARVREMLFLALSNRAETWLRLKDFRRALNDADRALEAEPGHAKCLVRRGKALVGLQRYAEACASFGAALEQFPEDRLIQRALRSSRACYRQSHEGQFDLGSWQGEAGTPICEFVGPLEVRRSAADKGAGRGLFLTESTAVGQLLMVGKALAMFGGDPREKRPKSALEDYWVMKASSRLSPKEEDLALCLSYKSGADYEMRKKLFSLFCGSDHPDVPSIEQFKPGQLWCPVRPRATGSLESQIDGHKAVLARIRKVVKYNAFTDFDEWGRGYSGLAGRDKYLKAGCGGLWLLPSFLNHSCAPNCTKVYIGDAMFLRASRAIAAGEELSVAYCDVSLPVDSRRKRLRKWGFECKCWRCLSETGYCPVD